MTTNPTPADRDDENKAKFGAYFFLWAWAISIVGVYFKVPVYVAVPIIMLPLAIYFITNQK